MTLHRPRDGALLPLYQPSFSVQIPAVHAFFHVMLVAPS
jgi:hypothetical protein